MIPGHRKTFISLAILVAAIGGGIAAVNATADASSTSSDAATESANSVNPFLQGTIVQHFAAQQAVSGLKVVVSAGPATVGSTSSAVVVGTNSSGQSCWTIVGFGGGVGAPFRCGVPLGEDAGEPATQKIIWAGCDTSGPPGSTTADSASCVGFIGASVASVSAELADGSQQSLALTDSAFAYAASTASELPVAFVAYDGSGQVVGHQEVSMAGPQ